MNSEDERAMAHATTTNLEVLAKLRSVMDECNCSPKTSWFGLKKSRVIEHTEPCLERKSYMAEIDLTMELANWALQTRKLEDFNAFSSQMNVAINQGWRLAKL